VGGEKNYKAPPLPKGEILGGIAGILENDVYRTRPRTLDLYGMYHDRKGTALKTGTDPLDMSNLSTAYGPRTTETLIEALFNPVPTHSKKESPFTYYVPLGHHVKKPSPLGFDTSINGSGSLNGHRTNGSMHSTAPSSASVYSNSTSSPSGKAPSLSSQSISSHGHSSESGTGGGEEQHKSWWQKISHSRPGTPAI